MLFYAIVLTLKKCNFTENLKKISVQMRTRACLCEKKVAYLGLTLDTLALQIRIL